jgi:hypothetical protein
MYVQETSPTPGSNTPAPGVVEPEPARPANPWLAMLTSDLTPGRAAVILAVLAALGAAAQLMERVMTAEVLGVPIRFVPEAPVTGVLALILGTAILSIYGLLALAAWIAASRGGRLVVGATVGLPAAVCLLLYLVLSHLSRNDASYSALYLVLLAMTLCILTWLSALAALARRALGSVVALLRSRKPPRGRRRGVRRSQSRLELTEGEGLALVSFITGGLLIPCAVVGAIMLIVGATGFGGWSMTVGGVAPRGAYLATPVPGTATPERLTLAFVDGAAVLLRPIARSTLDEDVYVPCGTATVVSLEGLELQTLSDAMVSELRVGGADSFGLPAGC